MTPGGVGHLTGFPRRLVDHLRGRRPRRWPTGTSPVVKRAFAQKATEELCAGLQVSMA